MGTEKMIPIAQRWESVAIPTYRILILFWGKESGNRKNAIDPAGLPKTAEYGQGAPDRYNLTT
jgi:hypothetical protein